MKKTGVFLLLVNLLFAELININRPDYNMIKPDVVASGALSNSIKGLKFYKNSILVYSYNEFIIKNLLDGSLKTKNIKDIKKAVVYKNYIFIYNSDDSYSIYIYDLNSMELVKKLELKNSIYSFTINNDKLYAVTGSYIDIYSLSTGELLNKVELSDYFKNIYTCYDKNYFLVLNSSCIEIYKNDVLINRIHYKNSLVQADILNGKIFYITTDYAQNVSDIYVKDVSTLKTVDNIKIKAYLSGAFLTNDFKSMLYTVKNKKIMFIYDLQAKKIKYALKLDKKADFIRLSPENKYVATAYEDKTYQVWNVAEYLKVKTQQKEENVKPQPVAAVKTQPKPKQNVTVPNVRAVPSKLEVYASQTEGFTPLKVVFSIISGDDVVAYYINFGDQEMLKKGKPPVKFVHTFAKPGEYKVFFAVKNKAGLITKKIIQIKVKEETFQDYKKNYGS
jgi:hypothetical protein